MFSLVRRAPPGLSFRAASLVLCALAAVPWASAQSLPQLPGGAGGGGLAGGALGALGAGGLPSVTSASPGNVAGLLQYCVKNNFLSAASASPVEQSLMGRAGGDRSGVAQGSGGLLQTGGGQTYNLAGGASGAAGGLKEEATRKVCDMVLSHAKSLL